MNDVLMMRYRFVWFVGGGGVDADDEDEDADDEDALESCFAWSVPLVIKTSTSLEDENV